MTAKLPIFFSLLFLTKGVIAATHYVDLQSANPTPPYTNWATAATVIQDAIDAAAGRMESTLRVAGPPGQISLATGYWSINR